MPMKKVNEQGYANDRHVSPDVVRENRTFGSRFSSAPFFNSNDGWSYKRLEQQPPPNIALGLPAGLASDLDRPEAMEAAAQLPCSEWCSILRSALAHGGVGYLDAVGRSSHGTPVKMFTFASGMYGNNANVRDRELLGIKVLRVPASGYRDFLQRWVGGLVESGIQQAGNAA